MQKLIGKSIGDQLEILLDMVVDLKDDLEALREEYQETRDQMRYLAGRVDSLEASANFERSIKALEIAARRGDGEDPHPIPALGFRGYEPSEEVVEALEETAERGEEPDLPRADTDEYEAVVVAPHTLHVGGEVYTAEVKLKSMGPKIRDKLQISIGTKED